RRGHQARCELGQVLVVGGGAEHLLGRGVEHADRAVQLDAAAHRVGRGEDVVAIEPRGGGGVDGGARGGGRGEQEEGGHGAGGGADGGGRSSGERQWRQA